MAGLQTVHKVGPILDLFTVNRPEWGVSEVAAEVGVPRSSAHALLSSLVDIGLLHCRTRGRYRIGWRVVELGETLRSTTDVRSCAAPIIDRLVETLGETTHLAVLDRRQVLYLDKVIGNHNITVQGARVGSRVDAHCTALGKVLLAQLDQAELERYLASRPLRRYTPTTITDPSALSRSLVEIRTNGYALDHGESVTDIRCVAAPIRDELGSVIAAISMSVPATRFAASQCEYKRAVLAAAGDISKAVARTDEVAAPIIRDDPSVACLASRRAS